MKIRRDDTRRVVSVDTEILDVVKKDSTTQYIANSGRNYPGYERDGGRGFCDSPGKETPKTGFGVKDAYLLSFCTTIWHA